ncbi:MAG: chemotaxis protein CheW [Pirellulaceae bacterium]
MFVNDPELVSEFITESSEALADIENQLLEIEAGGADIDSDLVNTVFRGIHSIKGLAGFLELKAINELAHNLEDVLNKVRNLQLVPTSQIVDVMLRAADELRALSVSPEESNAADVSQHVTALQAILAGDTQDSGGVVEQAASDSQKIEDAIISQVDQLSELAQEESDSGSKPKHLEPESLSSSPVPVAKPQAESDNVAGPKQAERSPKEAKEKASGVEANIRVPVSTLDHLMNLAGELVLNRNRLVQFCGSNGDNELTTLSSDIDQITCELQEAIMQTRMQPIATAFNRFPRIVRDLSSKLGKQCNLVVEGRDVEVDKSIIEAIGDPLTHLIRNSIDHGIEMPDVRVANRKVAAGTLRLAAYHMAGQVCIDIQDDGGGISPDKIKQKAVDNGIITDRQAAEMSTREALRLIFHAGFSTAEKLTDVSGRGVGMDVVRNNIEQIGGTVDVESEVGQGTTIRIVLPLTLAIIRSLIIGDQDARFAIPQVNVAELVRVSGKDREERIQCINDAVVLRLRDELIPLVDLDQIIQTAAPLSLTSNAGLAEGLACFQPPGSESESESESEAEAEAEAEAGAEAEDVLIDQAELAVSAKREAQGISIVILETGRSRYGIIVNELFDSQEIVVKPLGVHLKQCKSVAGATILGDGQVALILDAAGIAEEANLSGLDEDLVDDQIALDSESGDEVRLLIFRNAPNEQFAIPMELVSRIERIATSAIERHGSRSVVQYCGRTLSLFAVEEILSAQPRETSRFVSVVIVSLGGKELGIIAPCIGDICDIHVEVDTESLTEAGVIGSAVIQSTVTRILDVAVICKQGSPESGPGGVRGNAMANGPGSLQEVAANAGANLKQRRPRVLVVEDSKFFRKQIVRTLKGANYETREAADGLEALQILEGDAGSFDLMLTDIEMPNMNGFELCQRVRQMEQFKSLPIVALTSLSSEEDLQRGRDCGVDEYQVKLDADALFEAIRRLIPE